MKYKCGDTEAQRIGEEGEFKKILKEMSLELSRKI